MPIFILLATVPVTAASTSSADDAGAALEQVMHLLADEQYGKAWRRLVPAQRTLIDRGTYVTCRAGGPDLEVDDFEVVDVYREQVTVPGTEVTMRSWAVTAKIAVRAGLLRNETTETSHMFQVRGRWRWADGRIPDYLEYGC